MSFDWNWFFSSFCQSAAALIGIIGAFIISRLLGLSEKIASTISTFDSLTIDHNRIVESLSKRKFYWYTQSLVSYDSELAEDIIKGEYEGLKQDEILDKIYKSDSRLFKIDPAIMEGFTELYDEYKPDGRSYPMKRAYLKIPPNGFWDRIREERELIDQLEIDGKTLIRRFTQNLQDLKSFNNTVKPLKIVIIFLMVAFPLTVLYPLHFMPVALNENPILIFNPIAIIQGFLSLKFILLSFFFIVIESIFFYFITITKQQENDLKQAILNNSDTYRNINNYSTYFE